MDFFLKIQLDYISAIGCGYAECVYVDRVEKSYVCNFDQIQSEHEIKAPYKAGSQFCEDCKSHCDNKLCDCGKKECFHGGKLNLETCKCECEGFWRGDSCHIRKLASLSSLESHILLFCVYTLNVYLFSKAIEPVKNDLDCAIPFMFNGKLHYKCVFDPIDGYFCSKEKYYNGDIELCEDEHYDESLVPPDVRKDMRRRSMRRLDDSEHRVVEHAKKRHYSHHHGRQGKGKAEKRFLDWLKPFF